jgi:ubiquitin
VHQTLIKCRKIEQKFFIFCQPEDPFPNVVVSTYAQVNGRLSKVQRNYAKETTAEDYNGQFKIFLEKLTDRVASP